MTRAPANLLAVRRLLLDHLDIDPDRSRGQDLESAEVGIVGDPAHRGGYHCGSDRVLPRDYSVVESSRDSTGLTLDAAALDVGQFEVRSGGRTHDLRSFSTWCVAQCVAGTSDSRDIREIIYSPDGKVVRRWDRLRKRTSGDKSHLWHTHISFFRDSIKAKRDQTPLFRRYLTGIGLIEGDDDMDRGEFLGHFKAALADPGVVPLLRAMPWQYVGGGIPTGMSTLKVLNETLALSRVTAAQTGVDQVDEAAIIAGVIAGLDPATLAQRIAAALPADQAKQVADELARRLAA
ncbi:hypothetical protein [Micromonospora sp. NPDC047074]|uniref:hypothetical protein n=1 Tax=Micromonospora sp. NPDC047074 TaxID=3154339 RepID=UPI0033EFCFB7